MDSDNIYFAGSTDSDIGISKGNVHNSTYSGNTDGFFGKLKSKSDLNGLHITVEPILMN